MNTDIVIFVGTLCGIFWTLTYINIIWRGFQDRSYGMPIAALCANTTWEAIFSVIDQPFADFFRTVSLIWFGFDLIIAVQCFTYGPSDFQSQFMKKYFRVIFLAAMFIAFVINYRFVYEFHDIEGDYTGFGINCMMSMLFIGLLVRRDDIIGQSIYIAIFKSLGTLTAFLSTCLEITSFDIATSLDFPRLFTEVISHQTYPLTPLIKFLYSIIFCCDAIYFTLLYRKCVEKKINPWTRF